MPTLDARATGGGPAAGPRAFCPDDAAWAAAAYRRDIATPGRTRWTSATPERVAYWLSLEAPERGAGFVLTDADGVRGFAGFQVRNERADEAELLGPHPHRESFAPLVDAVEAEARRRGLRLVTWIGEEDAARTRFFARRGYARTVVLRWLHGRTPPIARAFDAYASALEVVPAAQRPDDYLRLYNEAFANHVGDHVTTAADMRLRLADPVARAGTFLLAVEGSRAVGCVEVWPDFDAGDPPGARPGWIGNIVVTPEARGNLEIHIALYAASLAAARRLGLGPLRGLLDPERTRLVGLYTMFGWVVGSEYSAWQAARGADA